MKQKIIIISDSEKWEDDNIPEYLLREKSLLKTLSIVLALRAGVQVPPTFLMLGMKSNIFEELIQEWGTPLMVRMDYQSSPIQKNLGGIPLYSIEMMEAVSRFLFHNNCYPLFHTHLDRFEDLYSAGVLMTTMNFEAKVEIVGKGFDASDLRLGNTTPHESMKIGLEDASIKHKSIISDASYKEERIERDKRVLRYRKYIEFVNKKGILLPSLKNFDLIDRDASEVEIPKKYIPVPKEQLQSLARIASIIFSKVLNFLPSSNEYVASFSFLPKHGWTLWDIYGGWYKR